MAGSVIHQIGRTPRSRHLPTVVIARVFYVASSSRGTIRSAINTIRRASIDEMNATTKQIYEIIGSVRASRVLFGPPDPGLRVNDQIVIPEILPSDPINPVSKTIWLNSTTGLVRQAINSAVRTLASYEGLMVSPVDVVGPEEEDILGGDVLVVIGPDENSARQGVQFRVDAIGQE